MKLSSAEIRMIRSLGTKKGREEHGLFVVEGEKMVAEVLESPGWKVEKVLRRSEIGEEQMERICQTQSGSPVLALVQIPKPDAPVEPHGLCLALDSVRDPGNLGTIIRIADWFGIDTVYCSPDSVELFNPKVVQSTMGALFRVRVVSAPIPEVCRQFIAAGLAVFGTFLLGSEDIYRSELPLEGLLVMGNESNGVCDEVAGLVTKRLFIPSFAEGRHAESLNVAIATAIAASEFKRRTK